MGRLFRKCTALLLVLCVMMSLYVNQMDAAEDTAPTQATTVADAPKGTGDVADGETTADPTEDQRPAEPPKGDVAEEETYPAPTEEQKPAEPPKGDAADGGTTADPTENPKPVDPPKGTDPVDDGTQKPEGILPLPVQPAFPIPLNLTPALPNLAPRGTDVSKLLTDVSAKLEQDGQTIGEDATLDSTKPIQLRISFGIPLIGDGGSDGTYVKQGDTATIELASGFTLSSTQTSSFALNVGKTKVGTLHFESTQNDSASQKKSVAAKIVFDGEKEVFDGGAGWSNAVGAFHVELQYDGSGENGNEGNHDTTILNKTYTVLVPAAPVVVTAEKSGARDGQYIDWTVKVEAKKKNADGDMSGYRFSDDLTEVGSYVANSFKVGTTDQLGNASQLAPTESASELEYIFPETTTGTRYIFFRTKIADSIFFKNGKQSVKNIAQIVDGTTEKAKADAAVDFEGEWIQKEAGTIDHKAGTISWTITANQLGAALPNAVITDVLDTKLTWTSANLKTWDASSGTSGAWIDSSTITFDKEPANGKYELGDINTPVLLTITAKLTNIDNILHTVQTVENKAALSWDGQKGIDSEKIRSDIGLNPIAKKATSYDIQKHQAAWQVTVKQSDMTQNLWVADLLIYDSEASKSFNLNNNYTLTGTTGKSLTQIDADTFKKLRPSYDQRYVPGSWKAVGDSDLKLTVYTVKNAAGEAVADLLIVTNDDGTGIDVSKGDQSFTFQTTLTNPDLYLGNQEKNSFWNRAVLFSANIKVNEATAWQNCPSYTLYKDVLPVADVQGLPDVANANSTKGSAANCFHYQDKSVVFRLHVNASGIVDVVGGPSTKDGIVLGNATISDTLPEGWEFVAFAQGSKFLLYEGQTPTKETKEKVTAQKRIESPAFMTADFSKSGTASFTFTQLGKPYLILVKARPTEETAKGYLNQNGQTTVTNTTTLNVQHWTGSASGGTDVTIKGQLLSKSFKSVEGGGTLNWFIDYNPYAIPYQGRVIQDILPDGLDLRTDSKGTLLYKDCISVQELTFQADGTTAVGEELANPEPLVSYDGASRTLTFSVPDGNQSYRLSYLTDVTGEVGATLSNQVKLADALATGVEVQKAYKVQDADASVTMQRSGWVQISKQNDKGTNLAGAQFTIFTQDGTPFRKGLTAADGRLTLRGLPEGEYSLQETKAPDGYAISKVKHTITVVKDGGTVTTSIDGQRGQDANKLVLTNVKTGTVGALSISKTLGGDATDSNKAFDFSVTVTGASGDYAYLGAGGKEDGSISFQNGTATFALKGGESIEIQALPKDATYTVSEMDYRSAGYTSSKTGDTGTIAADEVKTAKFVNTRNAQSAELILMAEKTLDGKAPSGSEYLFALKAENGAVLQTKANADGGITFDRLLFDQVGTYRYTISEQTGDQPNVRYDTTIYTVEVSVTKPDHYVAKTSYFKDGLAYTGSIVFANTTSIPSNGGGGGGAQSKPIAPIAPIAPDPAKPIPPAPMEPPEPVIQPEPTDPPAPLPPVPSTPNEPLPSGAAGGTSPDLSNSAYAVDSNDLKKPNQTGNPTKTGSAMDRVPQTGEGADAGLWYLLLFLSAAGMLYCIIQQKRNPK